MQEFSHRYHRGLGQRDFFDVGYRHNMPTSGEIKSCQLGRSHSRRHKWNKPEGYWVREPHDRYEIPPSATHETNLRTRHIDAQKSTPQTTPFQ